MYVCMVRSGVCVVMSGVYVYGEEWCVCVW